MPFPVLDELEIYTGMLLGPRLGPLPIPDTAPTGRPAEVLNELLTEALAVTPCHVAFSGGRDSSTILAAATSAARREGLPDPIPLTTRFPGHPSTQEDEWQEMVVSRLGLADWLIFEPEGDWDLLGDIAVDILLRRGAYVPAPAHSMAAMCRRAAGGSLITGTGGDEVFSPWDFRRHNIRQLMRVRPRWRGLALLGLNVMPARIRIARATRQLQIPLCWLTPVAQQQLDEAWRESFRRERSWRKGLIDVIDTRYYEVVTSVLHTFAADEGVRLYEPFFHPGFLRSLARYGPEQGFQSRQAGLASVAGDLLPAEVLRRSTKAFFNSVLAGPRMRQFASEWDGTGVNEALVDPEQLRLTWLEDVPDVRSLSALQLAWLGSGRARELQDAI